jgi:hypothetical protein
MQLQDKLVKNDIFGYGSYESIPVTTNLGFPKNYSNVVKLHEVDVVSQLYTEALFHIEQIGRKYVKTRIQYLPDNIEQDDIWTVLKEVGFIKGHYQGYGLRKEGTNDLLDIIQPVTRKFFENFTVGCFRQQYATAYLGWNTKYHIDHDRYTLHGFRCMVPLNTPVHIAFFEEGKNSLYKLDVGYAYFVNIGNYHRAFHHSDVDRTNLMFQMDSDKLILDGVTHYPISWDAIPNEYKNYNKFSDIMKY